MKRFALLLLLSVFWIVASTSNIRAQDDSSTVLRQVLRDSVDDIDAYIEYIRGQLSDSTFSDRLFRLEQVGMRLTELNQTLATPYDTLELSQELPGIERYQALVRTNILEKDQSNNLRSLYLGQIAIAQITQKLLVWQKDLLENTQKLRTTSQELNQFLTDTTFRNIPTDSTLRKRYIAQLGELIKQIIKVRLENQNHLVALSIWQGRVSDDYLEALKLEDAFKKEIRKRNIHLWNQESGILGYSDSLAIFKKPYTEILQKSYQRNFGLVGYYVREHIGSIALILLIWLGLSLWLVMLLRRIRKTHTEAKKVTLNAGFASQFPIAAALVSVLAVAPVFFINPPVVFLQIIWFFQFILVSLLVMMRVNWIIKVYWFVLLLVFIGYSIINLTVQNSYIERNFMLLLNTICVVLGWLFTINPGNIPQDYRRFVKPLALLMIGLEALAIVLLVLGRYSLAKIISVGALFNIVLAIELYIAVEFIKSVIYLQMESLQTRLVAQRIAEFDWERIQKQFTNILNWGAIVLWVIALAQNFNVYEYLSEAAWLFFSKERSIGDTHFSFGSIGIFVLIVWLASIVSSLIVQFFGGFNQQFVGVRKNPLGSAMLLVRLGVLAGGFLLAVSASGIQLDKLTIVFGALGVGIGFGLQNIVNNLVSGIILAFEKPLQVGDLIEIGPRKGIVREIGFRSSKIATFDGANVIVPNGDLLSQHLINWTMNGRQQRSEMIIGVAYGTALERAQAIMLECCAQEEHILTFPAAMALVHEFGDNAVNIRLLFWINDVDNNLLSKSSLLNNIYERFDQEGISIPFPQRDLHLRTIDPSIQIKPSGDKPQENTDESPHL